MKQRYTFWLLAIWLSVFATPSFAVTVTKVQDLNFGKLVAGSGGTVIINPNGGARTVTGGVIAIGNSGFQPAQFTIKFAPFESLLSATVHITPNPSTLSGNNGGNMPVTYKGHPYDDNVNICGIISCVFGILGFEVTLYVGGTMTVDPNETPGVYTNNVNVQVTKP